MNSSIRVPAWPTLGGLCTALWLAIPMVDAAVLSTDRSGPSATSPATAPYQGVELLDLSQMAEMRGGFSLGGLELNFGATLSTMIDNIQLDTVFSITGDGATVISQALSDLGSVNEVIAALSQHTGSTNPSSASSNVVNGPATGVPPASGTPSASQPSVPVTQPAAAPTPSSPTATPASPTATGSGSAAPSTATLIGPNQGATLADLAPVGLKLDGVDSSSGFSGLAVSNSKGFTAAVHKLTQNAAISAVISNASNQRVSQKLDISVNIENVKSIRQAAMRTRMSRITDGVR